MRVPPAESRPAASRPAASRSAVSPPPRRSAPHPEGGFAAALARAGEDPEEALLAALVAPDPPSGPAGAGEPDAPRPGSPAAGTPLLARAVERIALLVNSGAAPAVTLQLGRSMEVRVEQASAGVEVSLRAAQGLSPMAEAELPLLVAALRARGVRVARAGVLRRRDGGRPSLTAPRSSATRHGDDGSVAKW